jgi:cobalt-zinc-cadmium efflux system membrane fusion protein
MQAPEEIDLGSNKSERQPSQGRGWLIALVAIAIGAALCGVLWFSITSRSGGKESAEKTEKPKEAQGEVEVHHGEAEIQVITASDQTPPDKIKATGTVEANQQQMQQITALVAGRVEAVNVALGDAVRPGMVLIRIDSPQIAELHGKLHEAETKLQLAKSTLNRVKEAASRVAILKAKATLDEADSTLKRTKQLVSEGLTAGKDLVAASSEYDRAKAEYNFQKDISLNRDVAEAQAAVSTSLTEAEHIRDSLIAFDAQLPEGGEGAPHHDISTLRLRSPIAGIVIERMVNPGAGVEAGKPLLTIANISTLWVIANVPENEMPNIQLGMTAQVVLEGRKIAGRVSYIDPRLNEDTRTSRVRIVINNQNNHIQTGSFAQVEFSRPKVPSGIVYVPILAVQTIEGKSVVFVKEGQEQFRVRPVEIGEEVQGQVPVFKGLRLGEQIAVNGAFVLKSKLLKDQMGGDD